MNAGRKPGWCLSCQLTVAATETLGRFGKRIALSKDDPEGGAEWEALEGWIVDEGVVFATSAVMGAIVASVGRSVEDGEEEEADFLFRDETAVARVEKATLPGDMFIANETGRRNKDEIRDEVGKGGGKVEADAASKGVPNKGEPICLGGGGSASCPGKRGGGKDKEDLGGIEADVVRERSRTGRVATSKQIYQLRQIVENARETQKIKQKIQHSDS
ncbi:MAG: hypothetical protein Q9157_006354 [Trypethelium eluteriae]